MKTHRRAAMLMELVVAMAIFAVVLGILAQLAAWSLRQRLHTEARQVAVELAANVLESARAAGWADLTPEWADAQKLPAEVDGFLPDAKLAVKVEPQQTGTRKVTVTVTWQPDQIVQTLELVTLIGPRVKMKGASDAK